MYDVYKYIQKSVQTVFFPSISRGEPKLVAVGACIDSWDDLLREGTTQSYELLVTAMWGFPFHGGVAPNHHPFHPASLVAP